MNRTLIFVILIVVFGVVGCNAKAMRTGAEQPELYLPLLKGKKVGLVINNTSIVENKHLVDFLLERDVEVAKIFAPEHGFRGDVSAGGKVEDGMDPETGLPVLSLYGKTRKPSGDHLKGLDIIIFDIQDVGCRFYTYISTMHLVMEACAENDIPMVILDHPLQVQTQKR